MDKIPNFENLLNKNLSKYKTFKNINILEINQKSNNFFNFINKYFTESQFSYSNLKNDISNDGEKSSINIILKLIEFSNKLKQFDIIFLNTNFPIYNVILVMEELFKLLKFEGTFIYNNYNFYDYSTKVNIDTFIQIKSNDLKMITIDSLIIFKKRNNNKIFTQEELKINEYIKKVPTFYAKIEIPELNKYNIKINLKFNKPKDNLLLKDKNSFKKLNILSNKFTNFMLKSEINRIQMKAIDNQVFSRHRPYLKEKFDIFFKKFYIDSLDPIRFYHFYKFLELSTKYSIKKKDYFKYDLLSHIHFPNKKKIIYLHTIHNFSKKYKKINHPYIIFSAFNEFRKSNKKLQEFRELVKKKPKTVVKKTNITNFYKFIIDYKKLNNFEQVSHMLPFEYENGNSNVKLNKPTKRISFEIKTKKDIEKIKKDMSYLKIKTFDVIKLDSFYDSSKLKYPKSKYYINLFYNNIIFLLNFQTKNGSVALSSFGLYDDIYVDLIYILKKYYQKVYLKSNIWNWSDKIDISYSVICEKFKGINNKELNKFNDSLDYLYCKDPDLGKFKQKITNILDIKYINSQERNNLKNIIINFNQKILDEAAFKYNYYFNLHKYFFKKNSKNKNIIKKNLLSKQINDYITVLNRINLLEYKKYFH